MHKISSGFLLLPKDLPALCGQSMTVGRMSFQTVPLRDVVDINQELWTKVSESFKGSCLGTTSRGYPQLIFAPETMGQSNGCEQHQEYDKYSFLKSSDWTVLFILYCPTPRQVVIGRGISNPALLCSKGPDLDFKQNRKEEQEQILIRCGGVQGWRACTQYVLGLGFNPAHTCTHNVRKKL